MKSFPARAAGLAVVLAIAACGQAPGLAPGSEIPTVAVVAPTMTMKAPANRGALELDVRLGEPTAAYRLLESRIADWYQEIEHIEFTVTVEKLKEPIVAKITKDQFIDQRAKLQVNNLPPGRIAIQAIARDKDGQTIVEATGEGMVTKDEVTTINLICVPREDPGLGHVRIEMACWEECVCVDPTPAPSAFVPNPISIVTFKSWGDPHEEGGNGVKFDNTYAGTFLALQTLTKDFIIQKNQGASRNGKWAGKTVNDAVAIKSNCDVFLHYLDNDRSFLNQDPVSFTPGRAVTAPKGMTIVRNGDVFTVATPQGDTVVIRRRERGAYLDLEGTVAGNRVVHEVQGSLGTYNNGSHADAMRLRDGTVAPDLTTFLRNWAVRGDENLFPEDIDFEQAPAPSPAPTSAPSAGPSPTPAPSAPPSSDPTLNGFRK